MKKLSVLNLGSNDLEDVGPIGLNTSVVNLYLNDNFRVRDVRALSGLKLTRLELARTSAAETLPKIFPQLNLAVLDISEIGLQNLSEICGNGNMPKIRKLLVAKNNIKSLDAARELKSLAVLNVANNPVGSIAALAEIENLVALDVSNTKSYRFLMQFLPKLPKLLELYARSVKINDIQWVGRLPAKLRALDLGQNQISDVSPLYQFHSLRTLKLGGNPIKGISVEWLESLDQLVDFEIDVLQIESLETRRRLIEFKAIVFERKRKL